MSNLNLFELYCRIFIEFYINNEILEEKNEEKFKLLSFSQIIKEFFENNKKKLESWGNLMNSFINLINYLLSCNELLLTHEIANLLKMEIIYENYHNFLIHKDFSILASEIKRNYKKVI